MKKSYILLAHAKPDQLRRLITTLDDGESTFHVHIDAKSDLQIFSGLKLNQNVAFLENRVECIWGDVSIIDATILALKAAAASGSDGYTILLSGQDYPLVSNSTINQFLEQMSGADFIDADPVDEVWPTAFQRLDWYQVNVSSARKDYLLLRPFDFRRVFSKGNIKSLRHFVKVCLHRRIGLSRKLQFAKLILTPRTRYDLEYYGGSQWFALSPATLGKIIQFLDANPSYREFHRYTHVPDEMFFHSIIKHIARNDREVSVMPSIVYTNWVRTGVSLPVTFQQSDYEELTNLSAGKLFARKFDADICSQILDSLDQARAQ